MSQKKKCIYFIHYRFKTTISEGQGTIQLPLNYEINSLKRFNEISKFIKKNIHLEDSDTLVISNIYLLNKKILGNRQFI